MKPEQKLKEAVRQAQQTLAEYVGSGPRDTEQTIDRLLRTLQDHEVVEAVRESDEAEATQARNQVGNGVDEQEEALPHVEEPEFEVQRQTLFRRTW